MFIDGQTSLSSATFNHHNGFRLNLLSSHDLFVVLEIMNGNVSHSYFIGLRFQNYKGCVLFNG